MRAPITKFQILTDSSMGGPLFYCHKDDLDHLPVIDMSLHEGHVKLVFSGLMKVKDNRQRKNRVDIYMSIDEARIVGQLLLDVCGDVHTNDLRTSSAKPHDARQGPMELPHIIWSKYVRTRVSAAKTDSNIFMRQNNGWLNIDFETRHHTHIKMGEKEIHFGISLSPPSQYHDSSLPVPVYVPDSELRRPPGRPPEQNPIPKINGSALIILDRSDASGIAKLLRDFDGSAGRIN